MSECASDTASEAGGPSAVGGFVKQAERDDCYQACVATLLGLQLADVPNFMRQAAAHPSAKGWRVPEIHKLVREWARPRGLAPLFLSSTFPLQALLDKMEADNPGVPFILGGLSRFGTGHAVIVHRGRIVHEPTPGYGPEDGGVVAPQPDGAFEVTFFVTLPPWAVSANGAA